MALPCSGGLFGRALVPPRSSGSSTPELGFYLGYAELTREEDHRTLPQGPPPGHSEHLPDAPFQHLEKRYFEVGNEGSKIWRAFDAVVGVCICNDRRWPETFRVTPTPAIRPRKRVYCTAASKLSAKSSSSNRHVTAQAATIE